MSRQSSRVDAISQERSFDFQKYVTTRREFVETNLEKLLDGGEPELLMDSMRYSVLGGGKRLRALLCLSAAETIAAQNAEGCSDEEFDAAISSACKQAIACACAVEMVHAMSLIHDDLPALDNDDMRRGKPTNHKMYGEAIALLAGDALLMKAVEILIESTPATVDKTALMDTVVALTRATGSEGMVGGQVYDLIYTGLDGTGEEDAPLYKKARQNEEEITEEVVERIHSGKTAALIRFSLWSGARLAGASQEQLDRIERFGEILGLAFQITDDLLDVTGDIKTLGKTPGKDEASSKATWIRVFGADGAREKLDQLQAEGEQVLKAGNALSPERLPVLSHLLSFAIMRKS